VAGGALGLEDFLAAAQGTVDVADLDGAHLADALSDAALEVLLRRAAQRPATAGGLVAGGHVGHQADDDEHGHHEGEHHGHEQLLGGLDRAGVAAVGVVVRAITHGLFGVARRQITLNYSQGPPLKP